MIIKLYEENPRQKEIDSIVKILNNGGVIIYPTDTGYSLGCDVTNKKAMEKLLLIKNSKRKEDLSFICSDLKHISEFANISNDNYKILRKYLPGGYTFILEASNQIAKLVSRGKKTVGIRIPDNNIAISIVRFLGRPIITTSINSDDISEVLADPEIIEEIYGKQVDCVIDGGYIYPELSTVLDISNEEVEIIREGKGSIDWLLN
ncbi:MAG: threonylcarbamoyl-AMP synthase [Candidatus Delongbacteria bacterium]|nr:threonylcarbamoyl-AMP synthase [Candidatus Delongbacteria bacterium]MBN2835803.1 threonylcarbamoyl-AMP synthase [Candidatus Delongbacteria bacterium]